MFALTHIKLIALGVCALGLTFAAVVVNGWRKDAHELVTVRQQLLEMEAAQERDREASRGYQKELAALRASRVPARTVRLCNGSAVQAGDTPRGHSDSSPAAGVLPAQAGRDHQAGPDIGSELYDLAGFADEVSARLRACQGLHLDTPSSRR